MRNTFLTGMAMGALWIGIVLLVVGLWLNTYTLAFIGMLLGGLFGLPAVYLLLDKDHWLRHQVQQSLGTARAEVEARVSAPPKRVIENKKVVIPAPPVEIEDPDAISIPVNVDVQVEPKPAPKKIEQVVTQPKAAPAQPTPIQVPVDVLAEDDEEVDVMTISSEPAPPPEPPKPSEWELQKEADAKYKEAKAEIEALAPTDYDELVDYMGHEDARVRLAAVQRLRHTDDERVLNNLQQALDDDDLVVQRAARIALEEADERTSSES